eukprot:CAMPEP_0206282730 /NCGR_PEP_ID=MMETSP0047_2-20121206/39847_1 /ASSEMBLY_ACC=CAM_ASM_000192 /TAXON_ID=195065 /ORGANISM="Chroomonas mesostigmatica_cf, Strain CCMP1168" /LENGTH=45 /DNA_ID= /DNA_START= /DNA_END= /DNA_ORIENTATION=
MASSVLHTLSSSSSHHMRPTTWTPTGTSPAMPMGSVTIGFPGMDA